MLSPNSNNTDTFTAQQWGRLQAHQGMLQDRIRTLAYRRAIERMVKPGQRILDIGCGTGILSLFAANKGCTKVCAVEHSEEMMRCAREIAAANKLTDRIEFITSDIFDFKSNCKFDILLHEQLGHFVWDENMISKVAHIRENFLKPDAIIIPSAIHICIAPTDFKSELEKSMDFWSRRVYGFDFRCVKMRHYVQEAIFAVAPSIINLHDKSTFLCREKLLHSIDLTTASSLPDELSAEFTAMRSGTLRGVAGYFSASSAGRTMFSTRPARNTTHWKQFFLPCIEQRKVSRGDTIRVTINPSVKPKNWKFTIL
jgi:2-polyprenyl-3-methyl-5-hydroxy-6-metoxy-1,4-benzoquinol methylase